MEKLQRNLGGLRGLERKPDAIFVLDTKKEHIAVTEANKLGIPVVAVVDTNVDPELVQYPIPGNDDAIRANSLLARVIADAVEEGRFIAAKRDPANAAGHPHRGAGGGLRQRAGGGTPCGRPRPSRARCPARRSPRDPTAAERRRRTVAGGDRRAERPSRGGAEPAGGAPRRAEPETAEPAA